ncbi:hypothetical protein BJ742DRAFT_679848, partial [Cladochytrium replicatum]
RLSAGMSVLAAVKEVHDMEIVMSLPNQLTGYVSITEISNKITELVEKIAENDDEDSDEVEMSALPDLRKYVAIGQLLPCVILEVEEKSASTRRRVELTLKPDLVNRHLEAKDLVEGMALLGSVQSQEDHGYVIDLGIAGMNGFLSNDGASEYIERVNKGKTVSPHLCNLHHRLICTQVPPSHVLTFETLKPGQLVQAKIDSHLSNGLLLSFLGFFKGTVDLFHLDRTILPVDGDIDKPLANAYKANSKLRARVLYVDRERKRVGLSLKPHVVQWTLYNGFSNSNSVDVGTIIEDAKVIRMDQGQGLLLSCGGIEAAYVQMWRIADTRIDKIDKKYRVGSVHRARVIGFDYNAGLVQVSLQPRVLAMQFMKYSDLKPGMLLKGHVLKIIDNGVIVTIEDTIRGFIPKMHFADVVISKPEKKFKVGGEVKCQVISVDAGKKKLLLTARKSLMGADLPIVSKFEDAKPGMITMGVVVAVRQFGCIVRFYGDVQGLAPTAELSENTVKDPTRLFTVGQPCKCRVMRVDPRNNKLTVSFKLTPSSVAVTAGPASEHLNVGDVVSGKVIVLSKDSAVVELDGSGAHATLPKAHVSDHPSHVNRMFSLLREGSILREVVVLSKRGQRGLTVSLKPVLVSLAKSGDILQDVSNAQVGIRVPGFVKSVTDSTCFVGFFGEAFGMAKLHNMSDRYVLKGTDLYNVGQTVVAYVTEVDQEHGRMQISVAQGKDLTTMASVTADMALHDAIDPEIKTLGDLRPGVAIKVLVKSVKPLQVNVVVAKDLAGRIPLHELFDHLNSDTLVKDLPNPFRAFKPGNVVKCKVVGFRRAKAFNHLPFSHTGSGQMMVELTVRTADLALPSGRLQEHDKRKGNKVIMGWPRPASFDSLKFGDVGVGFVRRVVKNSVWVHIAPDTYGRIYALELSNDPRDLTTEAIQRRFTKSSAVMCKVIGKDTNRNVLELTVKNALSKFPSTDAPVQVGQIVVGRVTKVDAVLGLRVQIGENLFGSVHLTDISDNYKTNPTKIFKVGKLLRCCVIGKNPSKSGLYDLSLRASRVGELKPEDTLEGQSQELSLQDIREGMIVRGYVRSSSDKGCIVSLSKSVSALVKVRSLSDAYIKNCSAMFPPGLLVRGKILSVKGRRVDMTLKRSEITGVPSRISKLTDVKEGMKLRATVAQIIPAGLILQINDSNVRGLCHISELSDKYIKNPADVYKVGDAVKAVVRKVDPEKKKLSFGLKASYFTEQDARDDMDLDGSDDEVDESDESEGRSSDVEVINVDSDDDAISVDDDSDSDDNDDEEDGGDEEETGDGQKRSERKKSKRQRQRARNEEEERVSRRETQIAKQAARDEDELQLESAEDFDRVLLGEPNSSVLWIKYMAFHMQLAEVDRARDVAERALKAIGYREERERMNLWVAYMNLENMYGTQLSLLKVFERAAAANDPKAVYTQLARIYERTDKKELAEQLYKTMTKKFNESCKVWVAVANFYLKTGDIEQWRKIQQRALQSLPQRKHAKILTKFAQTEFKFGEPERGRTLFEGIISAYPKRVDIWNIYLDMEASYGDVDSTRRVFERVITIKTSSKKMKSFFKKYLEFEKRKGTPEGEQHVKEAAMAYVAKVTTA